MKISDLIGIQKGLIKVTQSLKKMKETFHLMHRNVKLYLPQQKLNQLTCRAFYESNSSNMFFAYSDHVEPTAFHGTMRIFVSGYVPLSHIFKLSVIFRLFQTGADLSTKIYPTAFEILT